MAACCLTLPTIIMPQLRPNMAYLGGGSEGPPGARHAKGDGDDSEDEDARGG